MGFSRTRGLTPTTQPIPDTVTDVPSNQALTELCELAPGDVAVVSEVQDQSDPVGLRLSHLGFLPGTPIRVLRRAPLGDPTVYQLRGNQMCLRRAESSRIIVRRDCVDTKA